MAGLVPAIHVLLQRCKKDVDGRHEAGHDVEGVDASAAYDRMMPRTLTADLLRRRRWLRLEFRRHAQVIFRDRIQGRLPHRVAHLARFFLPFRCFRERPFVGEIVGIHDPRPSFAMS